MARTHGRCSQVRLLLVGALAQLNSGSTETLSRGASTAAFGYPRLDRSAVDPGSGNEGPLPLWLVQICTQPSRAGFWTCREVRARAYTVLAAIYGGAGDEVFLRRPCSVIYTPTRRLGR